MALVAKEILRTQRSAETFIQKHESPTQQTPQFVTEVPPPPASSSSETFVQKCESPKQEQYAFVSKETGQQIDFNTGDGIGKIANLNTGTITKKKKSRQSLAVVPPPSSSARKHRHPLVAHSFRFSSAGSSKSSDDGDYLVPMTNDAPPANEKNKTNFTSYDGIQMFTFTLDDD